MCVVCEQVLSAYDFEQHADAKTRYAHNHINLENGKHSDKTNKVKSISRLKTKKMHSMKLDHKISTQKIYIYILKLKHLEIIEKRK